MGERTFLHGPMNELEKWTLAYCGDPCPEHDEEIAAARQRIVHEVMQRLGQAFDWGASTAAGARYAPDGGRLALACTRQPCLDCLMAETEAHP